jgi:hypothetical protein
MTLLDTLNEIRRSGGKVWAEAGAVRFRAPAGVITAEHKAVLVANKAILLDLLTTVSSAPTITSEIVEGEQQWVESLPVAEQERHLSQATTDWLEIFNHHEGGHEQGNQSPLAPLIPIRMRTETRWHDEDGFYDIPAGAPGWLVTNIDDITEIGDRISIADSLKRKHKAGIPSVAIWLGGIPRVVPQSIVTIGGEA